MKKAVVFLALSVFLLLLAAPVVEAHRSHNKHHHSQSYGKKHHRHCKKHHKHHRSCYKKYKHHRGAYQTGGYAYGYTEYRYSQSYSY
ncbi:MAG: hypothetical protein AAGU11_13730 [Syntrophobacteraceae bacterium]